MLTLLNPTPNQPMQPTLALAPMAGITDRVFRDICRSEGADYAVAEMVASQKQLRHSRKSATRQAERSEASPRIVQLLGTDPDELAEAAQWQAEMGADIIDFNMGCPAKKVCDVAAGSALMANPDQAAQLLDALVNAVN
ncbi:tRNA dihydrouridine synthase DusB, partial [Hydrogenovibrio sp. SC-1]